MFNSGRSIINLLILAGFFALLSACGNGDQAPEQAPPEQAPMEQQEPPAQTPPGIPEEPGQEQPVTPEQQSQAEQPSDQMAQQEAPPSQTEGGDDMQATMQKAGCFACHMVEKKLIGPAYTWVSHRYKDDPNAVQTLTKSIISGSQGKWTEVTQGVPMPPNMTVNEQQAQEMAEWILNQKPQAPPQG